MSESVSVSSPPLRPPTKEVAFDVAPVLQRYSSSSSVSRQAEVAMKASEKISSKSRCAIFAYNVPRSSIMLTLPSLVFLITGACLVATRDSSKDWFDDGQLLVAFVFIVVGGVWTLVAVVFWITLWYKNKPKLLPRNLNHLPPNSPVYSPNGINTNNNNNNDSIISNSAHNSININNNNNNDSNISNISNNNSSTTSLTPQLESPSTSHSDVFLDGTTPIGLAIHQQISYSQTTANETTQQPKLHSAQQHQ